MQSNELKANAIKICLIASLLQFSGCTKAPAGEVPSSGAFELEQIGVKSFTDAQFDIEYAFAHGFNRVDKNGASYLQISPQIILKHKQLTPQAQYKVVLDQRIPGWIPEFLYRSYTSGRIELFSRKDSRKIGSFILPRDGWPGDQAGRWLAKQLKPDPTQSRHQSFDVSKLSNISLLQPSSFLQTRDIEGTGPTIKDCPPEFKFDARREVSDYGSLITPSWTLLYPYSLREYRCVGLDTYVIRAHRQEDVEIIGINSAGHVFARGFVRNDKINLNLIYHHTKIIDFKIRGGVLTLRQAHFIARSAMIQPEKAKYEFELSIPMSAIQIAK